MLGSEQMKRVLRNIAMASIAGLMCLGLTTAKRTASSTLNIVAGGTYSGQWTSDDPAVPVIIVNTTEPVVIENSVLSGRGTLIQTGVDHTRISVRNVHGTGLNPNVAGKSEGRFFSGESFDSIVIENNE